jgi:predicted component of type VI protein secretion system
MIFSLDITENQALYLLEACHQYEEKIENSEIDFDLKEIIKQDLNKILNQIYQQFPNKKD